MDDLEKLVHKIKYERWICMKCAWYTNVPPNAHPTHVSLVCPECGNSEFHYTCEPYDHEE